jgi:ribulose-bisphosphate carboxylase small chain
MMRITQGQFSFLPDLTDAEIRLQCAYAIDRGWTVAIEFTDDPHPRNVYWEMWGLPIFGTKDPVVVVAQINACRRAHSSKYIKVVAFDSQRGVESIKMSFIVNRPADEPGFDLFRTEGRSRNVGYALRPYAADRPPGQRYMRPSDATR